MRTFKYPLWSSFVTVARPFFQSEPRAKALALLSIMVFLLLGINGLNVLNSFLIREFMTALEQQESQRFYFFGVALAAVYALASIGEAFSYFAEQRLGLFWREWLTRCLIDRYLAHRAFHLVTINQSIENPDERISEDVKTFTTSSLSLLVLLLDSLLALIAFLGVLWSITPWLVLTAVVYAVVGSLGTLLFGWRLMPLNDLQLQKEADLRFALARIRQHDGSDGQHDREDEKPSLRERFNAVVSNFRDITSVTRNVGFFTKEYIYLLPVIPILVIAPLYIHNPEDGGPGGSRGD